MPALKDITGLRFGRLTVLGLYERGRRGRHIRWLCQCDCGKTIIIWGANRPNSCGCSRPGHPIHGQSFSLTYKSWSSMMQRCYNPKSVQYRWYGGRGIRACERWHKFENLLSDMGERLPGTTLDRIDPDGNYEPGNCRWATPKEGINRGRFKPRSLPSDAEGSVIQERQ